MNNATPKPVSFFFPDTMIELDPDDYEHHWFDPGDQFLREWTGPALPEGFDINSVENHCAAGDACSGPPNGVCWTIEGWEPAWLLTDEQQQIIVCEDCIIEIGNGTMTWADGELMRVESSNERNPNAR